MTDYKDRVSGCATDIDWSKAPDWATKHGYIGALTKPVWFDDEKYTYVSGEQGGRSFTFENEGFKVKEIQSALTRPAPQWNGEGLPPAGCECEYFAKSENRWIPVVMIGTFRGELVLGCEETGVTGQLDSSEYQLRPRRTPAQIAAEEREAAIDEMAGWAGLTGLPIDHERKILGRLYDGNYRRMTKGDDK